MDDFEGTNFVDRKAELKLLNAYSKLSGLLIVLGRRRIGKTALLRRWLSKHRGLYSQAIEAARNIQLSQVVEDFSEEFVFPARPGSWIELLRLLDQDKKQKIICLDEFQYLVKADPSLPSVLQRWLDHENKSKNLIVLSGSSTKIMTETCIHANSPLYGRARQVIHLQPIAYPFFCEYLNLNTRNSDSFELFSLVGGLPKYWEHIKNIKLLIGASKFNSIAVAEYLYFLPSAFMEGEVTRFLSDEKIEGMTPISILEAIGRGAARPSEIGSRMGVPQTQLNKVLDLLISAGIIRRDIPFGSSPRNPKIVNYFISDCSILSWYFLASTHQARWLSYDQVKKKQILDTLTGHVFENFVRDSIPGAMRFWTSNGEIDIVYESQQKIKIAEVKWARTSEKEQISLLDNLERVAESIGLFAKYPDKKFSLEIFDRTFLSSNKAVKERTLDLPRKH